ncbi:MAG: putative transposase [Patiriisocius sp.]|jgi:putative transposase
MPSRLRYCPAGYPVHVLQRGNDRQLCFAQESDLAAYASWLKAYSDQYKVRVHGWVFMTNHVHLLLTPQTDSGISQLMQTLGRLYVRYFNHQYQRSGTLFEGRYRSSVVQQEDYLLACQRYIELNPVRAGLVQDPGDYRWSSYRAHAFGVEPGMWSPHGIYNALGQDNVSRQAHLTA